MLFIAFVRDSLCGKYLVFIAFAHDIYVRWIFHVMVHCIYIGVKTVSFFYFGPTNPYNLNLETNFFYWAHLLRFYILSSALKTKLHLVFTYMFYYIFSAMYLPFGCVWTLMGGWSVDKVGHIKALHKRNFGLLRLYLQVTDIYSYMHIYIFAGTTIYIFITKTTYKQET